MDKNAIKKYAVWARNELIARVTQKAEQYEITEKKMTPKDADSINGRLLTDAEKNQRKALIEKIQTNGFEQVMEEVAYTWFNRFTALRFMEVNNYLPSHTRVFTNEAGEFKPQILADAIQLDLEGLDMDKVFELKDANKTEELYKYLLITQCNALSAVLPRMFQKIEHYTELLLPDYLLREGSVIEQMITLIPEEDWTDQVQIIGWLYQFYNIEPKEKVFAALKKKVKITKENIPAATQLFTPDWIVHYMVENSLGKMWLEGHPNESLKQEWKYYLEGDNQDQEVYKKLAEIQRDYQRVKPEEIKCIDPCMGSGHILCVLFDCLVRIYEDYGYTAREAVAYIVEKNIWGLDIDERAAQLAYFAVMMKARQYDRRFLSRNIQPHVYSIAESNKIHKESIDAVCEGNNELRICINRIIKEMHNAQEYGSLLKISAFEIEPIIERFDELANTPSLFSIQAYEELFPVICAAHVLSQKYEICVTNPPYMGSAGMNGTLSDYVKRNYSDSKSDLFACFIERCNQMVVENGLSAMITQHAWMFLSSFENLRDKILNKTIVNMAHLGSRAFEEIGGEVVQTTSFVTLNASIPEFIGKYVRLTEGQSQNAKEKCFLNRKSIYTIKQSAFKNVPTHEIIYWVSDKFLDMFNLEPMSENAYSFQGMITGDNNYFLRLWHESDFTRVHTNLTPSAAEDYDNVWVPYNKGGGYRKWYGNNEYVLRWVNKGSTLTRARTENKSYYFKEGVTWSFISTGDFSCRFFPNGFLWDVAGSSIFSTGKISSKLICGIMNSKVATEIFKVINPTINYQVQNILQLPVPKLSENQKAEIEQLVDECVSIAKMEWDSFETSWDFKKSPLYPQNGEIYIKDCYKAWEKHCESLRSELKNKEQHINEILIDAYDMDGELAPTVDDGNISLCHADLRRDIRNLISYAVGCMFGRYSLDEPGLVFAGGKWNASKYKTFIPDKDSIIPVCDDEYFEDDIVGRLIEFIKTVYGEKSLEDNLQYISEALGGKGAAREVIRDYFINEFYSDHLKMYQKRPIYWMFDSGKKNGFKCLIYLHRYQADTVARIRTDYVHEQQSRYRTAIADLEQRINGASTSERVRLNKDLSDLREQAEEIRLYEEKIHHLADQMISLDLDLGIKKNYETLKNVLAKI